MKSNAGFSFWIGVRFIQSFLDAIGVLHPDTATEMTMANYRALTVKSLPDSAGRNACCDVVATIREGDVSHHKLLLLNDCTERFGQQVETASTLLTTQVTLLTVVDNALR